MALDHLPVLIVSYSSRESLFAFSPKIFFFFTSEISLRFCIVETT